MAHDSNTTARNADAAARPPARGFRRVVNATLYSISGLRAAWKHEAAFRQECTFAALLVPTGLWVGQNAAEKALLVGSCLVVLVVELLNSAIEAVVDRVGTDHHPLAARAKDLGSAAVFVSLLMTLVVFGLVIWQRFA